ncbi:MAG: rcc01693 family protein [Pseudomonadota bacterium]
MTPRRIDWAGLVRAGLHGLGLAPEVFWRLTPVELRIMLGADLMMPHLTRSRLDELAEAFPDTTRGGRDGHRGHAGATAVAGGDAGEFRSDGRKL